MAVGVAEHMKIGKRQFSHQLKRGIKVFFRLAGKANDDIRADADIVHLRIRLFYKSGEILDRVFAQHGFEDAIVSRLDRHVKVTA